MLATQRCAIPLPPHLWTSSSSFTVTAANPIATKEKQQRKLAVVVASSDLQHGHGDDDDDDATSTPVAANFKWPSLQESYVQGGVFKKK